MKMAEKSIDIPLITGSKVSCTVSMKRNNENLTVKCDCSTQTAVCDHIVSILFGQGGNMVSHNMPTEQQINEFLQETDVEQTFILLRSLMVQESEVKIRIQKAKAAFGAAIND